MKDARRSRKIFLKKIRDCEEKIRDIQNMGFDNGDDSLHELYKAVYDMMKDHAIVLEKSDEIQSYIFERFSCENLNWLLIANCRKVQKVVQYQVEVGELLVEIHHALSAGMLNH